MSKFLSLLCSLLICVATYAQEITVNGKVTANGEEMPGVTVAVKGGTHGTITSIDGSYSLQVEAKSTLVFSFIGYETVEMPVKGQKVINVDLKESSIAMEVNPEKPDVPLNKNDAFQKVQKRRVQEKR